MEERRVIEIAIPNPDGTYGRGSGYLVTDRVILTARHVPTDTTAGVLVRQLAGQKWCKARSAWSSPDPDVDVALLTLHDDKTLEFPVDPTPVAFGRLVGTGRIAVDATGFPWAQLKDLPSGPATDSEHIDAEITPVTHKVAGLYDLHIAGSVPQETEQGSPWAGMSGAAVTAGQTVVAVIKYDPHKFGPDRLVAVPAHRFTTLAGVTDHLPTGPVALEAIWPHRHILNPPYTPLPRGSGHGALLLQARYGTVPLTGRDHTLDDLHTWTTTTPEPLALHLLTGVGGSGKTRLAAELAHQLAHDWVTGFLADAADDQLAHLAALAAPRLIIIDDADLNPDRIDNLTDKLAHHPPTHSTPARILLLARQTGNWWTTLVNNSLDTKPWLATTPTTHLDPLPQPDRTTLYTKARSRYAHHLHPNQPTTSTTSPPPPPDLTGTTYDRPLYILVAALTSLDPTIPNPTPTTTQHDLLTHLLTLETQRRWQPTAQSPPARIPDGPKTLTRAVALATLTTTPTRDDAAHTLTLLPELKDKQNRRYPYTDWLHTLYPPTPNDYLPPLQPDPLAEHLTAHVLDPADDTHFPDLPTRILDSTPPEHAAHTLTLLANTAQHDQPTKSALHTALTTHLPTLLHTAIQQTTNPPDPGLAPLAPALDQALTASPQPDLAAAHYHTLPQHSTSLAPLATTLTTQAVTHHRTLTEQDPDTHLPHLARSLHDQASWLAAFGQQEAALDASTEAVSIHHALAEKHPNTYVPHFLASLHNLATRYAALGQHKAALQAASKALGHYRTLATQDPDTYLPNLAQALNTTSASLASIGAREDALRVSAEAVTILRNLSATDSAYASDLANSLNNQSNMLAALGQLEAARAAGTEAITHYRTLAAQDADAYLPDLALALTNLSVTLSDLRARDGGSTLADPESEDAELASAVKTAAQAVSIYRSLAEQHPDAHRPNLAMALTNHARALADVTQREAALKASTDAVDIYSGLAKQNADAFLPNLAAALNDKSTMYAQDQGEDALNAAAEAVTHYRTLADANPDAYAPNLAASLNNLSNRLAAVGRDSEAIAPAKEAVTTIIPYAQRLPGAYAGWLTTMGRTYLEACQRANTEPDADLLGTGAEILEAAATQNDRTGSETDDM